MSIVREVYYPPIMTISQAAAYLAISQDTLYKYAMTGKVPAFKLGNRWRFRKDAIDEKLREMERNV